MSESPNYFVKDPDSLLDYSIDWGTYWLGTDTIASSTWSVPAGLTQVTNTFDDDTATVWVSGGVSGQTYSLTNRITTNDGRIGDQTISLVVRSK